MEFVTCFSYSFCMQCWWQWHRSTSAAWIGAFEGTHGQGVALFWSTLEKPDFSVEISGRWDIWVFPIHWSLKHVAIFYLLDPAILDMGSHFTWGHTIEGAMWQFHWILLDVVLSVFDIMSWLSLHILLLSLNNCRCFNQKGSSAHLKSYVTIKPPF